MTPWDILAPSQLDQLKAAGYVIVRQEDPPPNQARPDLTRPDPATGG